jgi:hypothetical protein
VAPEVVSIKRLHQLIGHITPEAARALVNKNIVEGFKLDESSKMPNTCSICKYRKAHRKVVRKECEAPRVRKSINKIYFNVGTVSCPDYQWKEILFYLC